MGSAASTTTGLFRAGPDSALPSPQLLFPALIVLAAAATPAFSQQVDPACVAVPNGDAREIRFGRCVRSTIDAADPKDAEGIPYEDWNLPLEGGRTVQIDMDAIAPPQPPAATAGADTIPSFAFDTFLELRGLGGADVLASNDDREGSVNSTIVFTAPSTGTYVVRARPLFQGSGEYILRAAAPPTLSSARPLSVGSNEVPPSIPGGATFQSRVFTFEGWSDERIRLNLSRQGSGFGTHMRLVGPGGQRLAMVGEMSESLTITEILPSTGTYRVEIGLHSFGGAAQPPVLDFARVASVGPQVPPRLRAGETVDGEISIASPAAPDPFGTGLIFSDLYELGLAAGEIVTVSLDSTAFDPVLDAGAMSPLGFAAALTDDDGGGGRNSMLVLRPERGGTIVLRVRPLGNGTGRYRLRVVQGEVARPAE